MIVGAIIICQAPDELFYGCFDRLSEQQRGLLHERSIHCERAGVFPPWCEHCQFSNVEEGEQKVKRVAVIVAPDTL